MLQLVRVRYIVVVVLVVGAMGAAYQAMHTTQGIMSVAREEAPLSADAFRAPIVTIEAQLFAPAPLAMEQRRDLASAFDALRKALDARGGTHMARYSARELGTLAGLSRGLGPLEGADLERVRTNWMRVRSNTFGDASWFRFSEADPVAPAVEPVAVLSDADRATLATVESAVVRLESALDDGERRASRLGEPQPSGAADERVAGEWRDFANDWRDELDRARGYLPPEPGAGASVRVRNAWSDAHRLLDELSALPGDAGSGGRPPYREEWTRHVQNARRHVKSARGWIEAARSGRPV